MGAFVVNLTTSSEPSDDRFSSVKLYTQRALSTTRMHARSARGVH